MKTYKTVDEYIASYPANIQKQLIIMRRTIKEVAPEAGEKIAYGIPTFTFHGNLVHYGGYPTHIGFYPGSAPIAEYTKELEPYETSKGTVRFPVDKPLPLPLIRKIVRYRVKQNSEKKK